MFLGKPIAWHQVGVGKAVLEKLAACDNSGIVTALATSKARVAELADALDSGSSR
jgi:hypothetical protein